MKNSLITGIAQLAVVVFIAHRIFSICGIFSCYVVRNYILSFSLFALSISVLISVLVIILFGLLKSYVAASSFAYHCRILVVCVFVVYSVSFFLMFWLFARKSLICLLPSLWFPLSSRNLLSFLGYCNGSYVLFSTQASLLYLSFSYCVGCSRYLYIVFFFYCWTSSKIGFSKGTTRFWKKLIELNIFSNGNKSNKTMYKPCFRPNFIRNRESVNNVF